MVHGFMCVLREAFCLFVFEVFWIKLPSLLRAGKEYGYEVKICISRGKSGYAILLFVEVCSSLFNQVGYSGMILGRGGGA